MDMDAAHTPPGGNWLWDELAQCWTEALPPLKCPHCDALFTLPGAAAAPTRYCELRPQEKLNAE